jgi:hypothetical protein
MFSTYAVINVKISKIFFFFIFTFLDLKARRHADITTNQTIVKFSRLVFRLQLKTS